MSSAKTWPDSGFKLGDPVRTIAVQNPPTDWGPEAVRSRRFGVPGVVIGFHDSHGLCFDVRHEDDGTIGCYEARELALLPLGATERLRMPSAAEMGISVRQAAPRPLQEDAGAARLPEGHPDTAPAPRHLRVRVREGSLVVIEEKEPGVWTTIMAGPTDCSFFDVMLPADEPLRFGTWAAAPPAPLKGPGI